MKSIIVKAAIVCLCTMLMQQAFAQLPLPVVSSVKPRITIGALLVYSATQGDFKKNYKGGIGGEVFAGIGWGSTFLIGTAGASAFSAEDDSQGTLTYLPLKLGVKKFFLLNKLFINGDIGVASVKNKLFKESAFTADIGAGLKLTGLELGVYYNMYNVKKQTFSSNMIDIKAGYSFTF